MPLFCTIVGEIPGLLQWRMRRKFFHHLRHGYGLGFAALISSLLVSDPVTVYLCAISENSHHNGHLNILESYNSTRFNAVMKPLPKEGSNNNILFLRKLQVKLKSRREVTLRR